MDFGLARHTENDQHLTTTGLLIGTPAYMSPEQVRGDHRAIDARTDIYSLGVLLYQLLTGRLPFEGPLTEVLVGIKQLEPPRPCTLRPDIDRELDVICRRAMAKRPANRYQTARAFADALDGYLRTSPEEQWSRERRRRVATVCTVIGATILVAAVAAACVRHAAVLVSRSRDHTATAARSGVTTQTLEAMSPVTSPAVPLPTDREWEQAISLTLEPNRGFHEPGTVKDASDRIFFRIRTVCDGRLKVEVGRIGGPLDSHLRLYSSDPGRPLIAENDDTVGTDAQIITGVRAGEEYLIEVSGAKGTAGPFGLLVNNSAPSHAAKQGHAAGLEPASLARRIELGPSFEAIEHGELSDVTGRGWFQVKVVRDGWLRIEAATVDGSFDPFLRVDDAQGRGLESDGDGGLGTNALVRLPVSADSLLFIEVTSDHDTRGRYTLHVSQPDAPGDDVPDEKALAHRITLDATGTTTFPKARVDGVGDEDWFVFTAPRSGPIVIDIERHGGLDAHVMLHDHAGLIVEHNDHIETTVTAEADYWLCVRAGSERGSADLAPERQPRGPYIVRVRYAEATR